MLEKIQSFRKFIGQEVVKYLLASFVVGGLWFAVESSFIFVIQGFLLSIGLLNESQVFLPSWYPKNLLESVLILITFGLLRGLTNMLKGHLSFLTQISFTSAQRQNLLLLSLKNAPVVSTKESVTVYTEVITQSGNFLSNLSSSLNIICSMALFLISGLKIAPFEMFLGVFLLAFLLIPLKYATRKISALGVGLVDEWEIVSELLIRGLKNYFFLSIFKQLDVEINKGGESITNYRKHYSNYSIISGLAGAFPMIVGIVILSLITFISLHFIKTDPIKLLSFFYLFIRFSQSAGEASVTFSNLKLNSSAFNRLIDWSQKLTKLVEASHLKEISISDKEVVIEVRNLSFGFNPDVHLINDLDFKVSPGEMLVIKGQSGVGKSTLLALLLGIYQPKKGLVKINEISTSEYNINLEKILGYVGPEAFLIQGTIRQNLVYGMEIPNVVKEDLIWRSLDIVELSEFVKKLKFGLDEPIHDIPQLSTGQKQRLSLARALVRQPRLLILDEATANLDASTESKILENLKPYFSTCTSVVVTHKETFDKYATQLVSLG